MGTWTGTLLHETGLSVCWQRGGSTFWKVTAPPEFHILHEVSQLRKVPCWLGLVPMVRAIVSIQGVERHSKFFPRSYHLYKFSLWKYESNSLPGPSIAGVPAQLQCGSPVDRKGEEGIPWGASRDTRRWVLLIAIPEMALPRAEPTQISTKRGTS